MAVSCSPFAPAHQPICSRSIAPWRQECICRFQSKRRACDAGGRMASGHLTAVNTKHPRSKCACPCRVCGRRGLISVLGGLLLLQSYTLAANAFTGDDQERMVETFHPAGPDWYEEFVAKSMDLGMRSYEVQMARYKTRLLSQLGDSGERILELGVGTGPNLKYYAGRGHHSVVGLDPNQHMEKYARAAASVAGLTTSQFQFVHAVGEAIPLPDSSVDAVVSTLVLCSVNSVGATLAEVQRVLKPGGCFVFVEHVAAPEGTILRFLQNVLDPLQQAVADGCHLTRETLDCIKQANFESVDASRIMVPYVPSIISPHILGTARKGKL